MPKQFLHNEHLELDGNRLHIVSAAPKDFEVWLNTDVGDFDGLCIGCGSTREKAVYDAAVVLEKASRALRTAPVPTRDVAQGASGGDLR